MKVVFELFLFSKTAWVYYLPFKQSCLKQIYAPLRMGNAKTIGVLKIYPLQDNHTYHFVLLYIGEQGKSLSVNYIGL